MSKVTQYEKMWSFNRYNDMYDPNWQKTHFLDENFFGPVNLF